MSNTILSQIERGMILHVLGCFVFEHLLRGCSEGMKRNIHEGRGDEGEILLVTSAKMGCYGCSGNNIGGVMNTDVGEEDEMDGVSHSITS